jgi:hypothetical protein
VPLLDPLADGDLDSTDDEATTSASAGRQARPSGAPRLRTETSAPTPPPRPGLATAFRSSFRPLDVRADLRALPQLVRHWSFFVPVVLSGVAVVLFQYFPRDQLVYAVFGYFAGITPFGAVMLAGFFAPRASWLVGILVSLAAVAFLTLSLTVQIGGLPDGAYFQVWFPAPGLVSATDAKTQISGIVLESLTGGAVFGGLFASAAAWYRRFLTRANPNRVRPSTPTSRRPDGKVPKKPQQRPMLARRR